MAANNDDPVWTLLILLGIFMLGGWLIWFFFHPQIMEAMRYLRMAEIVPLLPFDRQASACFLWLRIAPQDATFPTDPIVLAAADCFGLDTLRQAQPGEAMDYFNVTATSLGFVSRVAMSFWRWPLLLACFGIVYRAIFVCKKDRFRTWYTLETFIKAQAVIWPVIKPIVSFNPAKHSARVPGSAIPAKLPLFAESLSPEEWISFHEIPVEGGIPDRERTRQSLAAQLGPRWRGYDDLPLYMQGLLAAFALKGVQKRDESDDFLGRLSLCWNEEKGFVPSHELAKEIKKILADPKIGGKALAVANKHAYRITAILGVLQWGRYMGGVLAAAQFLWVRGTDRTLWYALNNLGRRSFHMEGSGALAHYMAENAAHKALPIPRLETAIVALNQYFAANQPTIPPFAGLLKKARSS